MKNNISFYPMPFEKKNYCGQFVLKCIFKYLSNKEYDEDYLSQISEKFGDGFTLTIGLAYAGLHEGLNVKYISKDEELVSDKEIKDVEKFYENKQLSDIQRIAAKLLEKSKERGLKLEIKTPTLKEIFKEIDAKHPIITIIDYGKIYGIKEQTFHFVLLTGYDDQNVYFHDVGPKEPTADKAIEIDKFYTAWTALGTDMDTLIFSKK